jgi:hypothetical protein
MKEKKKARIIALYLPQFHPIPENDEWWGKGFTEWTNIAQARPLFKGHYQPRIPKDFGFYDLRMSEIREMQAEYARKASIEGFMYWQYYFSKGKMLLERPFEEVLKSGNPDYPFCLGWANHSWQTKTWKRDASMIQGKTMIMEQRYDGVKQYTEHFMYNLPAFKDNRYITVDGKSLFFIWNPNDHKEEIKLMIETWRRLAIENGLKGIHFVARNNVDFDWHSLGFDAVYENRENKAIMGQEKRNFMQIIRHGIQKVFGVTTHLLKADFGKRYKLLVSEDTKRLDVYPTLLAGYDRSPRAGRAAQILYNFTPETWRMHVKDVLEHVKGKDHEHNIVILKSWNEWGESNYVEPDLKYGKAILDVLREEIICND